MTTDASSAPVTTGNRITSLDAIRGFALLGILVMNAVSFTLPFRSYFRIDGPGTETWLDWVLGAAGEIFVDQKFMGLFSMLFGAGIALFADRAAAKGRRPMLFSLWRNFLLLLIGLAHGLLWGGDILLVYAICSPVVVALRNASSTLLLRLGTGMVIAPALWAAILQTTISPGGEELGDLWLPAGEMSDAVGLFFLGDYFLRALGMMLIGVVLFNNGFLNGTASPELYRRAAVVGLGAGWTLAAVGVAVAVIGDFEPSVAMVSYIPNTIGTIPAAVGYAAAVVLWGRRVEAAAADGAGGWQEALHVRLQAVGRMALTNYLTHTVLGVVVLSWFIDGEDVTRTILFVFVLVVWAMQLAYSAPWLARFRYGPVEWLWRCATYRQLLPITRG
ncbi:MAG: DUF418 domain-containing protein [Actinomycetota bacterium]